MRELTGQDEMAFLDRQAGGVHTRLAGLAVAVEGADLPALPEPVATD